jgi:alpha-tubulin suppressor-like RCC1 family protein
VLGASATLALLGTITSGSPVETQAAGSSGSAGRVLAWGFNNAGQLGNGTTTDSSTPVQISLPPSITLASVAGGVFHSLAVTSTGKVLAWGLNSSGQLGNGTTTNSSTPVSVSLPSGTTVTAIAAGFSHSLALTSAGQVLAWGDNTYGQLGNGTTASSSTPVQVSLPSGTNATAIASGLYQSMALTSTGKVLTWGYNLNGQLGNGTILNSSTPVPVSLPPGTTVTGIAGGYLHSLALTSSGQVLAWGDNSTGQLGNGTNTNSTIPVQVSLPSGTIATAVSSGRYFSLALTSAGQVLAWGQGNHGQLGNGSFVPSTTPVVVSTPSGTFISAIACGGFHSLALTSTRQVLAWGLNGSGQLGNGTISDSATPIAVNLPYGYTAIAGGSDHSLAIQLPRLPSGSRGSVFGWGNNLEGELGNGSFTNSSTAVAASLPAGTTVTAIAGGYRHSLALTSSGQVLTWGYNTGSTTPVAVSLPSGTTVTAIAGGFDFSLAVTSTGQVLAWGLNDRGQLGNGTTTNSTTPVAVSLPSGTTVSAVAGGSHHSLALTSTGQVLAWGWNGQGQLGNGTTTDSSTPVSVNLPSGTIVTAIATGTTFSLAVTSTGQALAWGSNSYGELGNGTNTDSSSPVPVSLPSGTAATAIAGGEENSLALTSTGQVLAWGDNQYGEVGNGTTTNSSIPVAVSLPSGTTATAVAGGGFHSMALTSGSQVLAWGFNGSGQLGNGTTNNSTTPVLVSALQVVTAIAVGGFHSLAIVSTTTIIVTSSASPSTVGGSVTYTATVVPTPDGGAVGFTDNSVTMSGCGAVAVNSGTGSASCTTSYSAVGNHTIVATYSGDTNYAGSSATRTQQVNATSTTTTTVVASSANPSTVGSSVTYTATVVRAPDGGTVAFTDNATTITGCAAVAVDTFTGKAICTTSYSAVGSHVIVAIYSGDTNYAASTSGSLTQQVKTVTTTTAASSSNPSTVGNSVTYTATVAPTPDGGTVAFTDNATTITGCGAVAVNTSTGKATCTTSYSVVGSHVILARYSADTNFAASNGSLTQQVNAALTTTAVVSSSNPSTVGNSVIYTATVAPTPDGGTVAFTDNATTLTGCGAVAIDTSTGKASCTTSYSVVGSHSIVASFGGTTNYGASSGSLNQQVTATTRTTLASSSNPSTAGSSVTYTATVAPARGTVAFTDNGPPLTGCGATVVNTITGNATCTTSYSAVGSHFITANYGGDTNYDASSGSLTQQVNAVNTPVVVLPAMTNGAYGGYVTAVTIQNTGTVPASVRIAYFDQNGAPVGAGDSIGSLPVNASWTVRQDNGNSFPSSGGDAAQAGSAVVYSSQPVAAFVNEFAPGNVGDATSYSGVQVVSGLGTTLYAPTIVNNAYGGYTTGIGLLNEGSSPTDVTITYRDGSGAVVNTQTVPGLAGHAYHALYSGDTTLALPSGFAGTATITSSAGQPLGAIVNETGPGGQFSSYDAVPSAGIALNAPVALNNAFGGYYTGMGIQNTSASPGTVTVTYYDAAGTPTVKSFSIAANGSLGVYQGSASDGPAVGAYTATITSTVAIAAIVNEVAPSSTSAMQSTSYNAFGAGSATLNLPLVENAGSDPWNTGEGIMNTGTASTTVTVNYYNTATGAAVGTPQTQTLGPHAFWGLYQPTGGLPSGTRATAVVTTASGGQVAVICNESSATTFMSYDGQ